MPELSRFFGIIIRMHYDDHNPPHVYAEHQDGKILLDFHGNVVRGELKSCTAPRLVREWIDLHVSELEADWTQARAGQELKKIAPLD
jgi:hypothetical protein